MFNITIHNLRNEKPTHIYDVRVDRTSPLGNPFYMANESQRHEVCLKYTDWFKRRITNKDSTPVMDALNNLLKTYEKYGILRLFCWCAPKQCHAETIRDYLINIINGTSKL